jgi:hypothetical protein
MKIFEVVILTEVPCWWYCCRWGYCRCRYPVTITGARFALSFLFTISTNNENTIQAIWSAISLHDFLFQQLHSLTLNTLSFRRFLTLKTSKFSSEINWFQYGEDIFESEHHILRNSLSCNYADVALDTLPLPTTSLKLIFHWICKFTM